MSSVTHASKSIPQVIPIESGSEGSIRDNLGDLDGCWDCLEQNYIFQYDQKADKTHISPCVQFTKGQCWTTEPDFRFRWFLPPNSGKNRIPCNTPSLVIIPKKFQLPSFGKEESAVIFGIVTRQIASSFTDQIRICKIGSSTHMGGKQTWPCSKWARLWPSTRGSDCYFAYSRKDVNKQDYFPTPNFHNSGTAEGKLLRPDSPLFRLKRENASTLTVDSVSNTDPTNR